MITVTVSPAEHAAGHLTPDNLAAAEQALESDGFVGLINAVPAHVCDTVYEAMVDEFNWAWETYGPFRVRGGDGFAANDGPIYNGHSAPPRHPYLFNELLYNEFAIDVTAGLMGEGVHVHNYDANWSLPARDGSTPDRQHVHGDAGHLFPGFGYTPFFILNLSIPLVDFNEDNGATEIWPGTHRMDRQLSEMTREEADVAIKVRRAVRPPERMVCPKGTVVIRDPRAWHAGMPNFTDKIRIMIAMRHFIFWMRCTLHHEGDPLTERTLAIEEGAEDFFCHPRLHFPTESRPAPYREYLHKHIVKVRPDLEADLLGATA